MNKEEIENLLNQYGVKDEKARQAIIKYFTASAFKQSPSTLQWVMASERLPLHLAFWNFENGALKDCLFPVRMGRRYYMAEIFDERLKDEPEPKYSFYFNGRHHYEEEFHLIEWLDESESPLSTPYPSENSEKIISPASEQSSEPVASHSVYSNKSIEQWNEIQYDEQEILLQKIIDEIQTSSNLHSRCVLRKLIQWSDESQLKEKQ